LVKLNSKTMITRFNNWWKVWGQLYGFVGMIVYLNAYFMLLSDRMQKDDNIAIALTIGWLVSFFGLAGWYSWQMRKHGWKMSKSIRDTH